MKLFKSLLYFSIFNVEIFSGTKINISLLGQIIEFFSLCGFPVVQHKSE